MRKAVYPVGIFGIINADWIFRLRRLIGMENRAATPDFALARTPSNTSSGFCYLFRGGIEVGDLCDVALIEIPTTTRLLIQGVISSFTASGENRPTRNLAFIPDKVSCDINNEGYDMLYVKAHDTFAETYTLLQFNQLIKDYFPEFRIDWMDYYPKVDIMAVEKGKGEEYAEALNTAVRWSAVTLNRLCLEMGKDIYTEDIR